MKQKSLFIVFILIGLLISVGSSGVYSLLNPTKPVSYTSFVLTASGSAYTAQMNTVSVVLSLSGTVTGNFQNKVNLNVKGGTANVDGYQQFAVSSGSGYVSQKTQVVKLNIAVLPNIYGGYGSKTATWNFDGVTVSITGNVVSITLTAASETLPTTGNPILTTFSLTGIVTLQ